VLTMPTPEVTISSFCVPASASPSAAIARCSFAQIVGELGEVVIEREVDHRVHLRGRGRERLGPREIAARHFRARKGERRRRRVGAREPDDRMPCALQLADDGRTDETRRTSDKYSHGDLRMSEPDMTG